MLLHKLTLSIKKTEVPKPVIKKPKSGVLE